MYFQGGFNSEKPSAEKAGISASKATEAGGFAFRILPGKADLNIYFLCC